MDKIYKSPFYGDNTRWFVGTVEDISDPMKLGRIRVRIRGVHSSDHSKIDTSDLPWAQVIIPSTEGGTSGIGKSTGLLPGSEVFGLFLDGDASQLPLIFGSLTRVEYSSETQRQFDNSNTDLNINNSSNTGSGTGVTGRRNNNQPSSPSVIGITGNSNVERAFNYFVEYGFTPQQAAGIVGNLMQESGTSLNTSVKAAGSEQSFGIAQWNAAAGRFQKLQNFAQELGKDWTDLEVQLRFITYELENYSYLGMADIRNSTTIEQATRAFQNKYERPSTPHESRRIAYAKDVYNRMVTN
jgi:hypothetical protein